MTDLVVSNHEIISTIDDLMRISKTLIKSGMLPRDIKTEEQAAVIILKGRELGMPMMESFALINVIQGKPTVAPQGMLGLINRSRQMEDISVVDDGEKCTVTMKRRGRNPHSESFSMKDANMMQTTEGWGENKKTIPLAQKYNWRQMPTVMRKWRAVAACARVVFPDVIGGMYTPEEMGADVDEDGEIVTVEPVAKAAEIVRDLARIDDEPLSDNPETPANAEVLRAAIADVPVDAPVATIPVAPAPVPSIEYQGDKVRVGKGFYPAKATVGDTFKRNTTALIERLAMRFSHQNHMENYLLKHFGHKQVASLTSEQYAAVLLHKEQGSPYPDGIGYRDGPEKSGPEKPDDARERVLKAYGWEGLGWPFDDQDEETLQALASMEDPSCLRFLFDERKWNLTDHAKAFHDLARAVALAGILPGSADFNQLVKDAEANVVPF